MFQKFVEHQFRYYIVFLTGLAILNFDVVSESDAYISWGYPCKIPRAEENLKPNEKCDKGKGMECKYHWYQRGYCLCILEASNVETITYDRKSKECRLKVGQFCNYVNATANPDKFKRQTFYDKCHEDAECQRVTEKLQNKICICKHGFIPSNDGSECQLSTSTAVKNNVLCDLAILIVFPLRLLI